MKDMSNEDKLLLAVQQWKACEREVVSHFYEFVSTPEKRTNDTHELLWDAWLLEDHVQYLVAKLEEIALRYGLDFRDAKRKFRHMVSQTPLRSYERLPEP